MLELLYKKRCTLNDLATCLDDPETAKACVRVHIVNLRAKMRHLGIGVSNGHGGVYEIVRYFHSG